MIRSIIEQTGAAIDVSDDGLVSIASANGDSLKMAMDMINEITAEAEVGKIYDGKITSEKEFGFFVEIMKGVEGLCHISELAHRRLESVQDSGFKTGDHIAVKLLEVDAKTGKMKLSHKATLPK